MPYTKAHKDSSREKILRSAVRLFSRKGFEKVSIDDLMADAGLTRGAFYAHFGSKPDLYAEAVLQAARQSRLTTEAETETEKPGDEWFDWIIDGYLDHRHVNREFSPCPLAFLATDVAHQDPKVRGAYSRVYDGLVRLMNARLPNDRSSEDPDLMLAVTAMMIGGVAVSRALTDRETVERLLASCRNVARQLVNSVPAEANETSSNHSL